jgi:hypothetical protein
MNLKPWQECHCFFLKALPRALCVIRGAKISLGSAEMVKDAANFSLKDARNQDSQRYFRRIK